ncbi:MAG: PIN domain-containing protein [Candidatus Dormibacteraceae bacterium]
MITFVDTNILIYAHATGNDPRSDQAREQLKRLWNTRTGAVSTQVLQEFYSVATRKLKPKLAKNSARQVIFEYVEWCSVYTDPLLIVAASQLEEEHSLNFWDALVIVAALRAGAKQLLSEDLQHGRKFGDLVVVNPFFGG